MVGSAGSAGSTASWIDGPGGSVASQPRMAGSLNVASYTVNANASGRVEDSATLQITGTVANGTIDGAGDLVVNSGAGNILFDFAEATGMTVMGTSAKFIDALATMKGQIKGAVSSSVASTERLKAHGIAVFEAAEVENLSVYIDGADEIDPHGYMIKGGGAALTREKIVAELAERFVCIADESKLVQVLGKFPLPVEVIPMAAAQVIRAFCERRLSHHASKVNRPVARADTRPISTAMAAAAPISPASRWAATRRSPSRSPTSGWGCRRSTATSSPATRRTPRSSSCMHACGRWGTRPR